MCGVLNTRTGTVYGVSMAVVYSPRVVEIAVIQSYYGRPAVNVWHLQAVDETWPKAPADMVRDFANNWQDHILDCQASAVQLLRFDWRSLDANVTDVGTISPDTGKPQVGQSTGTAMSPNVAWLLHKRTDDRPRGRRDGRSYLVGAIEDWVDGGGAVTAGGLGVLETAAAAFYDGISDTGTFTNNGMYPVVLETTPASRTAGTTPVTISSRRVTSIPVDTKVATQRERLR